MTHNPINPHHDIPQADNHDEGGRICLHCKRTLPESAFYARNRFKKPDSYCKECRRYFNRKHRLKKQLAAIGEGRQYPLIVAEPDRQKRIDMLRHAKQLVTQRIARKQLMDKIKEDREFDASEARSHTGNPPHGRPSNPTQPSTL